MKESAIDRERAAVAHDQAPEVTEPGVGAFDNPTPPVAPQRSAVLFRRFLSIAAMRHDQFNTPLPQSFAQRIAVIGFIGDHPHRLLPRSARLMTPPYPDRRQRRFRDGRIAGRGVMLLRAESGLFLCSSSFYCSSAASEKFASLPFAGLGGQ